MVLVCYWNRKLMSLAHSLPCRSQSSPREHNSVMLEHESMFLHVKKGLHLLSYPFQRCSRSNWLITDHSNAVFFTESVHVDAFLFIRHYFESHLHFTLSPLTYMLKFSRFLRPSSDRDIKERHHLLVTAESFALSGFRSTGSIISGFYAARTPSVHNAQKESHFSVHYEGFVLIAMKQTRAYLKWHPRHSSHSSAIWIPTFCSSPCSPQFAVFFISNRSKAFSASTTAIVYLQISSGFVWVESIEDLSDLQTNDVLALVFFKLTCTNDPSAGSPTETLLRLLLPLSDKVY